MRLAVVGVGSAGSRIANRILHFEKISGRNLCNGNSLLITSSQTTFDTTERIPDDRRLMIGDVHREADSESLDDDPELAADVAREDRHEINRAFDFIEFHEVDGVLLAAGLGGGTGGGAGAVVIDQVKAICDKPVYAIGVLPSEAEGDQRALNAARSLQSFVTKADNVIVFDNDTWQGADASDPDDYASANHAIAKRAVTLFGAGEFNGSLAGETRMDPSDIIRTLDTGGISSIGYASTDITRPGRIQSFFRALRARLPWSMDGDDDTPTAAAKINQLVRRAAHSKLTLDCDISSADRALIVLSGPPRELSRKGFESGRYWLEKEADTVEVMAGDDPHNRTSTLTAVIVFSNVTEVPRIDAMQAQATKNPRPQRH